MKWIGMVFKKLVLSVFILYGYNLIASSFNQIIPINIITVGAVGFLGFPALFAFILIRVFLF